MDARRLLPRASSGVTPSSGPATREWYSFFERLCDMIDAGEDVRDQLAVVLARIQALEAERAVAQAIFGRGSIVRIGNDFTLEGDLVTAPPDHVYGTESDGTRGWVQRGYPPQLGYAGL